MQNGSIYSIKISHTRTPAAEHAATVIKLLLQSERITAIKHPTLAESTLPVAKNIAGTVITESTEYGI